MTRPLKKVLIWICNYCGASHYVKKKDALVRYCLDCGHSFMNSETKKEWR